MFERIDGMRTIEFGTPGPSREKLVNLILHGQKRATADFRESHLAYWTRVGETVTDDTLIVTVYFDLI